MIKSAFSTLFLLFIFFLYFHTAVVAGNPKLITQLQLFDNDTTFKFQYLYNDQGLKVLETCSYKKNNIWVNKSQIEWLFVNGLEFKQVERSWDLTKWVDKYSIVSEVINDVRSEKHYKGLEIESNLHKSIESNYEMGNIVSKKVYSKFSSELLLVDSTFYKYKNNQLLSSETRNFYPNHTFKQSKDSFIYYADGKLFMHIYRVMDGNRDWLNVNQTTWFYNFKNGKISSQRMKVWDNLAKIWTNSQMYSLHYNSNDSLVEEKSYVWGMMVWKESTRYSLDYYSDGLLQKKSFYIPIYNQWKNFSSINYGEIDLNNQKQIESVFGFWGGVKDEPMSTNIAFSFNNDIIIRKAKKLMLVYSDNTDLVKVNEDFNDKLLIYPNPSSGVFYFNNQKCHLKKWSVSNLNGSIVLSSENNFSSGVIDLSNFPKGVYLIKAVSEDKILTQKLIKN